MKAFVLLITLFLSAPWALAQNLSFISLPDSVNASFRGLSVVDETTVWLAGSKGWVGRSTDGGQTWAFEQIRGYEALDFRSLYAFSAEKAIVANAGSPGYILLTEDAGKTWQKVGELLHPDAFMDGVDFWNENEGLIYGDPIEGHMLLMKTQDGGRTWQELPLNQRPKLEEGEASFAASGTNIRCMGEAEVRIATGGKKSRLWVSENKGANWKAIETPILQGESAQGIFSFDFYTPTQGLLVGGDYTQALLEEKHVWVTTDGGSQWTFPSPATKGYRSGVAYLTATRLLACGTSGIDISENGGLAWRVLSEEGFHVVKTFPSGKRAILAGGKGKVGLVVWE
ncbi:YCF48-related protein [Cytophagales bacterium LB-30]|uniref:YCF48-related protein n=1 Tax=Shiella aurantiaca TaxID=3058365 RepID=A0ABT8F5D9_9BACT|nr:YCF48-related protein [Shiella aurantiaca]MDN4165513.1 YCF48-related protein [Shiella aurantiaca]